MDRHVNEFQELFLDNFRDAHEHGHGHGGHVRDYIYALSSFCLHACDGVHANDCIIYEHAIFIHYDYALT